MLLKYYATLKKITKFLFLGGLLKSKYVCLKKQSNRLINPLILNILVNEAVQNRPMFHKSISSILHTNNINS